MSKFQLTKEEFLLAVLLALCGLIFSAKSWLVYMADLTPMQGFGIYYLILFIATLALSKLGFSVFNVKISDLSQILGLLLITFSFFVVFNWENPYVQYETMGDFDGASPAFYGSEDAVTWYFYTNTLGITDTDQARILTFVVTPFALTLLGGYLVAKPKLNLL